MDQECAADGVPDEDRACVQLVELVHQHGLPGGIAWVGFIRHARIENGVAAAERALEAADQLVVPGVMDCLPGALNEQNLRQHLVGLHAWGPPCLPQTRSRARWLPWIPAFAGMTGLEGDG